MLSRLHDRLGTAGLIIAIVALIAALTGTAYAALPGLNSKQKKEVKSIAKSYAGENGKNGASGAQGATGPQGPAGAPGKNGSAGENGESVEVNEIEAGEPECAGLGGAEVKEVKAAEGVEVCSGQTGFTDTLPLGKTEAGAWTLTGKNPGEATFTSISFAIPLPEALEASQVHLINTNGKELVVDLGEGEVIEVTQGVCTGDAAEPTAEQGNLCVYMAAPFNPVTFLGSNLITTPDDLSVFGTTPGAGVTGAIIRGIGQIENGGGWAVTS